MGSCLGVIERESREKVSKSEGRALPDMEQFQAYRITPKPYSEPRQMRFQMRSSVATRWAKHLHTRDRLAKEATSTMAVCRRMPMRTSDGITEIGQGGGGDPSTSGSTGGIEREAKDAISCGIIDTGGPRREWWAGFGTVTGALDGLGFVGFDLNDEGGKCLFL